MLHDHYFYWLSAINGADNIRRDYYFHYLGEMREFWHKHRRQLVQPYFWKLGVDYMTHSLTSELIEEP